MAKRYFEIELSDDEYDALLFNASEHNLTPSAMIRAMLTDNYNGEQINKLTKYILMNDGGYSLKNIYEYTKNGERIENCQQKLGDLYYQQLKGVQDKNFNDDVRDAKEELTKALNYRNEIWEAVGIADTGAIKYNEENMTLHFFDEFIDNIVYPEQVLGYSSED